MLSAVWKPNLYSVFIELVFLGNGMYNSSSL